MRNLIKTIQNTAFHHELWKRGDKLVIGVSGGADSVCLLDAFLKIAPKADLELIIAHVNYGLRDKDSEKDEAFVKSLAEKYSLIAYVLKPKVRKNSSENELRDIRYDFFENVRRENDFDSIAVAHNADDQVETFLMRVIRGSGLQGLSGMKFRNAKIIRPLLNVSRQEILKHLKKTGGAYRTDRTNSQDLFFRNKVRNKLLPELEKNYNPNIRKTLATSINSISEDFDFLNSQAEYLLKKQPEISVKKLLALHPAMQRRLLLSYIKTKKADLKDISSMHIEEILKTLRSTKGKSQIMTFCGLKLTKKNDKVTLSHL